MKKFILFLALVGMVSACFAVRENFIGPAVGSIKYFDEDTREVIDDWYSFNLRVQSYDKLSPLSTFTLDVFEAESFDVFPDDDDLNYSQTGVILYYTPSFYFEIHNDIGIFFYGGVGAGISYSKIKYQEDSTNKYDRVRTTMFGYTVGSKLQICWLGLDAYYMGTNTEHHDLDVSFGGVYIGLSVRLWRI